MTLTPSPPATYAIPRRASTLVLLRDQVHGMEVLMLRRAERPSDRSSGAYVFPGGTVDDGDAQSHAYCVGLGDCEASARLGLKSNGLDYFIAAVRECFEEAGVLLAVDPLSKPYAFRLNEAERWSALRSQVREGVMSMAQVCTLLDVRMAVARLVYHSHWLTPPGLPKRFDTRFFVAEMPAGQDADSDNAETVAHRWIRASEALDRASGLELRAPTRRTLEAIAPFTRAADCIAHVSALRDIPMITPVIADGPQGLQSVQPDEPPYAEVRRMAPHGAGSARYTIDAGRCVDLSSRVHRITAPNPGLMTGPGTNTYLVGDPAVNEWAVIDPGPADDAHVEAVLAAATGPIRWILVTHTHRDHSPATRLLRKRTGASCLGLAALHDEGQDTGFVPDRTLAHGDLLQLSPHATLRVIHTPGHAANHLCYLLEQEKTLFTGDHVMQGSTVVISPPDGDMGAYIASLQSLLDEDLEWLAPGHGFLIGNPHDALQAIIRHRRAREAKVLQAMADGESDLDILLRRVYHDVPAALHPAARRTLLAHLLHLRLQEKNA